MTEKNKAKFRRIRAAKIKKYAELIGGLSIPLAILLFVYLQSIEAITITGYSGDIVCAGTPENPCYAYLNFTANTDIYIYPAPNNTWLFSTDKKLKLLKMERKWGNGWREIKLNESCNGRWCGCYWCDRNHKAKYSYVFRKGRSYQIRFVGYKYNPYEDVKWSFGNEIDPIWKGIELKYKIEDINKNTKKVVLDLIKDFNLSELSALTGKPISYYFRLEKKNYFGDAEIKLKVDGIDWKKINPNNFILNKNHTIYEVFEGCKKFERLPDGKWGCSVWTDVYILGQKIKGLTWWNSSWNYRQAINISNTAGNLTNYQVKIELNSSNVGANFNWSNNGSDIRFTNSTDDLLSYWIESWNSSSQEAVIWVNVTYLENNTNTTIYMYYGNPSAESESNGSAVFEFFDDFNADTSSQYTVIGYGGSPGSFTIDTENSWAKTDTSNAHIAWKSSTNFSERGYIVETETKTGDDDGIGVGWLQDDGTGYAGFVREDSTYGPGGIDKKDSTSEDFDDPEVTLSPEPSSVTHHWYYVKLSLTNDSVLLYVEDLENGFEANATLSDISYIGGSPALISAANNPEAYYKYLRVRKYADPEPTTNIGAEETVSGAPIITVISPTNGGTYYTDEINFSFKVVDNEDTTFWVKAWEDGNLTYNNTTYQNGTVVTFILNKTEGTHNVTVWAQDNDLNTSQVTHIYYIENNISINVNNYGLLINETDTQAIIRQISPIGFNFTIYSSLGLENYTIIIQNCDPDLVNITTSLDYNLSYDDEFETILTLYNLSKEVNYSVKVTKLLYPQKMCFAVTGDIRYDSTPSENVDPDFIEVLKEMKESGGTTFFTPLLGDIVAGDGTFTSTGVVTSTMHQNLWDVLLYNGTFVGVVGNHDMARDTNQGQAEDIWEQYWKLLNFSWSWGNWYFINVDTYRDDGTAPSESSGAGFLFGDNWNWTADEITSHNDKYLIVMFHHPVYDADDTCGGWQNETNCIDMRNMLEGNGTKLVLQGHDHIYKLSTHGSTKYLIEGRGGAELHGSETYHGFSVVCIYENGTFDIYRINTNDGHDIDVSYDTANNYTHQNITATINNSHSFAFPVTVKFRVSGDYTYNVSGADWYYEVDNSFGKVIIATKIIPAGTTTNISVFSSGVSFSITLNSPANGTATCDPTPDFSFTVSGNKPSYSCELFINNSGYGTATVNNNVLTTITANHSLSEGTYNWYVNCSAEGVTNQSEIWEITIDMGLASTIQLDDIADVTTYKFDGEEYDHNGTFQIMFDLSDLPSNIEIINATMCLYLWTYWELDDDANVSRVDDHSWTESITINEYVNQNLTNSSIQYWSSTTENTWTCLNVKDIVLTDYKLGYQNTSIRVTDPDLPDHPNTNDDIASFVCGDPIYSLLFGEETSLGGENFYSKETSSYKPYLNVTYCSFGEPDIQYGLNPGITFRFPCNLNTGTTYGQPEGQNSTLASVWCYNNGTATGNFQARLNQSLPSGWWLFIANSSSGTKIELNTSWQTFYWNVANGTNITNCAWFWNNCSAGAGSPHPNVEIEFRAIS